MKKYPSEFVEKGIPVNLSRPLFTGDIKSRRNSNNIQNNFNVIKNLIGFLEMVGRVQKVNFRPLVVSPLNVVLKANGSPRLIPYLSLLNKFVQRGLQSKAYQCIKFSPKIFQEILFL